VSTLTAAPPEDHRWRRTAQGLGLVSAVVLLVGLADDLTDPVVAGLTVVGVGAWLVELGATPGSSYVEGGLLLVVGGGGGR
jgi:hypothetical protein